MTKLLGDFTFNINYKHEIARDKIHRIVQLHRAIKIYTILHNKLLSPTAFLRNNASVINFAKNVCSRHVLYHNHNVIKIYKFYI